jgi:hypothetical protein
MLDMVKHVDREREREEADIFPVWEEREEKEEDYLDCQIGMCRVT